MSDVLSDIYGVKNPLSIDQQPVVGALDINQPPTAKPIEQAPQNAAAPVWEDSKPIADPVAPSWADSKPVFDDRFYNPTKQNWGKLRQAFGGDPLAVFEPGQRIVMERALLNYPEDQEGQKKRFALAAYYSQMKREDYGFVLANLDGMIERYEGQPMSVDSAFKSVQDRLVPGQLNGGTAEVVKAQTARLLKPMAAIGWMALEGLAHGVAAVAPDNENLDAEENAAAKAGITNYIAAPAKETSKYYDQMYQENYAKLLPPDWVTNSKSAGDFARNAMFATLIEAPAMGAQAAAYMINPAVGIGMMAAGSGAEKMYDLRNNNPNMSDFDIALNATATGLINGTLEMVTVGILKGRGLKLEAETLKAGYKEALKYYAKSLGKESLTEGTEQLLENTVDLMTGVHGDAWRNDPKAMFRYLLSGVPESAVIGGIYGMGFAGLGHRNLRAAETERQAAVQQLTSERDELLGKGKAITEKEMFLLKDVNQILDGGNLNDQLAFVRKREIEKVIAARNNPDYLRQIVNDMRAENAAKAAESDIPLPDLGYDVAPEVSEEAVRAAADAARSIAARRELPHNPADVLDAVDALRDLYAAAPIEVVPGAASFSAEQIQKMVDGNRDPERVRAFVDEGKIYINASRVRPSEVPALLLHEGAAHLGLRKIFPKQFNDFLDAVYREHYQDDDFQRITAKYFADSLMDTDQFSLDDLDSQRLAAEEYVAHFAEYRGVKPDWWAELMQQIRMFLAKLPGMTEVRMTDQEIGIALARGARAMQKANNTTVDSDINLKFSLVSDPELLKRLDSEKTVKVYRAAQLIDGKLYPPMAAKVAGEMTNPIELGKWEQSEERSDLVKKGKFKLDKANGSAIQAAYNPYFHTSRSPLNDQFSSAYKRPNLVTMEVEVPASELTSGYKADGAKDAVGEMEWHSGPVSSKLTGDKKRRVILSRWDKPIRVIPDSEVAERIAKMIDGSGLSIPENVISPSLRDELEKRNVEIKSIDKDIRFSIAPDIDTPAFKAWFGDSKVVDADGKPLVVYHGTGERFNTFDKNKLGSRESAFFFTSNKESAKEYGNHIISVYLKADRFVDLDENYRDANGVSYDVNSPEFRQKFDGYSIDKNTSWSEYVVFEPTQIKSATDNVGTYDPNNPDIRFSIEEYSPEEQRDFVNVLAPFVGNVLSKTDAEYAAFLQKMGVTMSERDAHYFAVSAMEQNKADARKIGVQKRERWLYENVPLYSFMIDQGGADFKIQPTGRFKGVETSGTFIAKKKNEGLPLDALAREYVRKFGGDELAAEQEIFDFFKDLQKPGLYKMYTDYKAETILRDKNLERQIMEEYERMQRSDVEQQAEQAVAEKQVFTPEWIKEHKDVFAEIYQKFFGKEYPGSIGKADLTALNEAIANGSLDLFNVYREARQAAAREYMAKLADFKESMMKRDLDRVKLQREALNLLDKNLPPSERGAFARKIVGLLEFSTNPSANYPDGRRAHEFNKLVSEIMGQKETVSRESSLAAIREMLDAARVKRNYKNIPTSVLPSMQSIVNEIDKIMGMNLPTLNHYLANNLDRIAQLEQQIEQTGETEGSRERLDELQNFNMAAEMFGNVDAKTAAELDQARNFLQTLIRGGRAEWRNKLSARLAAVKIMRDDVIDNATFGKRSIERGVDNKKHFDFILKNLSLRPLLNLISGGKNFDDTVLGRMYQALEAAKEAENTGNRVLSDEFNQKLEKTFGIKGMIARGKKLIELGKVVEKSGVFVDQYSVIRQNVTADRQVIVRGQRPVQQVSIKVEEARKLLQKIDNGETVTEWRGFMVNDFAVEFLRKQLLDYDAGLKFEPEHFNEISDDANFNRLIAEDYKNDKLSLFANVPEETSSRVELPLSQLSALQLYLTYQQNDYKNLMKWNGWSDESIKQLETFLTPETVELGKVMRDMIAAQKTKLNQIVVDRYGASLPDIANYFPAVFGQGARFASDSIGRGMGQMSMAPDFLIARKFHLKSPATDANAMTTFFDQMVAQTHYISHSEAVRDFKSVFGNKDVQDAIANNFGSDVSKNIIDRIDVIAKAGGRGDRYLSNLFNNFYRNFIPAKLAVNAVSAAKQLASVYGFMHKIPAAAFFKGMAKAYSGHADFRNFFKMAVETDYFKNRWSGAFDKDLTNILNTFKNGGSTTSPVTEYLLEKSLIMTKAADAWSVLTGGYAVYEHTLNNSVKQGYSEAEAQEMALAAWQRASDETQQSGALLHQNYFQSQQGLVRYLTMFQTSPIQLVNLQFEAVNQLRYGKDKKAAAANLAKVVVLNHLVLPLSMQLVFDALTKGLDVEDYEASDYLIAGLLGQLNSVFLFGKLADAVIHGIAGDWRQNNFNSLPMVDEWLRDSKSFGRLFDDSRDVTDQDMLQMVKATGDGLMAAGTAYKPVGGLGAVISGAAGQVKRWLKTADGQ